MNDVLTVLASVVMPLLLDQWAKWQLAASASHYTRMPVYEVASISGANRMLKHRFMPVFVITMLGILFAFRLIPALAIIVAFISALTVYCAILAKGWMGIIRENSPANVR